MSTTETHMFNNNLFCFLKSDVFKKPFWSYWLNTDMYLTLFIVLILIVVDTKMYIFVTYDDSGQQKLFASAVREIHIGRPHHSIHTSLQKNWLERLSIGWCCILKFGFICMARQLGCPENCGRRWTALHNSVHREQALWAIDEKNWNCCCWEIRYS